MAASPGRRPAMLAGPMLFSPARAARKEFVPESPCAKDDHATLRLEQFCAAPAVEFGRVKVGDTKRRLLRVENIDSREQTLELISFPEEESGFVYNSANTISVPPSASVFVEMEWSPDPTAASPDGKNVKKSMTFKWNGRFRLRVDLFGCAIKLKKGNKRGKSRKRWGNKKTLSLKAQKSNLAPSTNDVASLVTDENQPPQGRSEASERRTKPTRSKGHARQTTLTTIDHNHARSLHPEDVELVVREVKHLRSKENRARAADSPAAKPAKPRTLRSTRQAVLDDPTFGDLKAPLPAVDSETKEHRAIEISQVFYDENWAEKQARGFTSWLNFVLCADKGGDSPKEESKNAKKQQLPKVNPLELVRLRKEEGVFRRQAFSFWHSSGIEELLFKIDREVSEGGLVVRSDRNIHADMGIRGKVCDMIMSFNLKWLKLGLETVYGKAVHTPQEVPMGKRSAQAIVRFLVKDFFASRALEHKFTHVELREQRRGPNKLRKRAIHTFKKGYAKELSRHTLKRFLHLMIFLEKAKHMALLPGDPILFREKAAFKSIRDMIIQFSKDYLKGEGDITRHLAMLGVEFTFQQTPLQEYNFHVNNLAVDLRDGVRLARLAEIISTGGKPPSIARTAKPQPKSARQKQRRPTALHERTPSGNVVSILHKMRLPAETRLRRLHNVEVALRHLQHAGVPLRIRSATAGASTMLSSSRRSHRGVPRTALAGEGFQCSPQDIVDGFRDRTLSLLWQVILHWGIGVMLNTSQLEREIQLIKKHAIRRLSFNRRSSGKGTSLESSTFKPDLSHQLVRDEANLESSLYMTSDKLQLLLKWAQCTVRAACIKIEVETGSTVSVPVSNFTRSFADGRALCLLIHYYHPALLPANEIQGLFMNQRALPGSPGNHAWVDFCSFPSISEEEYSRLKSATRDNFRMVNAKATALGCLPLLLRPKDIINGVPDEKVVITFVTHLAIRLLDLSSEIHAAYELQRAWRKVLSVRRMKQNLKRIRAQQQLAREQRTQQQRLELQRQREEAKRQAELAQQRLEEERRRIAEEEQRQEELIRAKETRRQRLSGLATLEHYRQRHVYKDVFDRLEEAVEQHRWLSSQAVVVQTAWRAYKARCELKHRLRMHTAAISIQCLVRSHRAKRERQQLHLAMQRRVAQQFSRDAVRVALQRAVCAVSTRQLAAVQIQAVYKGFKAREEFEVQKATVVSACVKIQSLIRRRTVQGQYKLLRAAAVKVQSLRRARVERNAYQATLTSIKRMQRRVRSQQAIRKAQQLLSHLQQERQQQLREQAAITVQAKVRGFLQRQSFARARAACVRMQAAVRRRLVQARMGRLRKATIQLQAAVRMKMAQARLARLRKATIAVQAAVRTATLVRKYRAQRAAAVALQAWWRARTALQSFREQRGAGVQIQRAFRAFQFRRRAHLYCATLRAAAVKLQCWTRQRRSIQELRKLRRCAQRNVAAVCIQSLWRRRVSMQRLRELQLQALAHKQHAAAVALQSAIRSFLARRLLQRLRQQAQQELEARSAVRMQSALRGFLARRETSKRRLAIVLIQALVRSSLARKQLRRLKEVQQKREAAATQLQRVVRGFIARARSGKRKTAVVQLQALVRGVLARKCVCRLRHSRQQGARTIQTAFRGFSARKRLSQLRREHLRRTKAATALQSVWRGWRARVEYRRAIRSTRLLQAVLRTAIAHRRAHAAVMQRQKAAAIIQVNYRAHQRRRAVQVERQAQREERAARVIQTWMRSCLGDKWLARRALIIQCAFRSWVARERGLARRWAIVTIQSVWRGRQTRQSMNQDRKIVKARQRIEAATKNVREEDRIGNRTRSALEMLLESKQLTVVTQACRKLDAVTKLLASCCVDAMEQNAVDVILALMQSCNRSKPHLELVKHGLSVLRNLAACPLTSSGVFKSERLVEVLVEQLQIYRDKEHIFLKAVRLLRVGCTHDGFAAYLKSKYEVANYKRMKGVFRLVSHKLKIVQAYEAKRTTSGNAQVVKKRAKALAAQRLCVSQMEKLLAAIERA